MPGHAPDLAVPAVSRLDLTRSGPFVAALLVFAAIAFWPSYLSRLGENSGFAHLHAALATSWILILVMQPILIRRRRRDLHRAIGRVTYVLAPLVVLSIALLAYSEIAVLEGEAFARKTYVLYLQTSLALLFGGLFAAGVLFRRDTSVHSRFMVATAFTLIDPIAIRILLTANPEPTWNYQWATFGVTNLVIVALILAERNAKKGRWVFPTVLAVFVVAQAPALLGWTNAAPWQRFAGWFAGL